MTVSMSGLVTLSEIFFLYIYIQQASDANPSLYYATYMNEHTWLKKKTHSLNIHMYHLHFVHAPLWLQIMTFAFDIV